MRECRVCVLLSLHCGVHASMIGGGHSWSKHVCIRLHWMLFALIHALH